MRRFLAVAVLAILATDPTLGQSSRIDSTRIEWLRPRVVVLDNVMPDGPLPSGLTDAVDEARIVALGEATHGDGTAFEIRNALTRGLHEEFGFDVLALEATGLYQLPDAFNGDADASTIVDSVESWLWRSSLQARRGLEYAARTTNSPNPLRVKGFDVQHSPAATASLFEQVERAMQRAGVSRDAWPGILETMTETFGNPFAPRDTSETTRIAQQTRAIIEALREPEAYPAQLLETALSSALVPWTRSMDSRDRQMGKNLVYLAAHVYPEERIMAWGASSHFFRMLPAIDTLDPTWAYDGSVTMGDVVADAFRKDYYVVAFTTCGGSYGAEVIGLPEEHIPPPDAGSLEALVCALPFESAAFLDLRGLTSSAGGAWLSGPLLGRPLGYTMMRASWPLVLDGMVVVREMASSTPSYSP